MKTIIFTTHTITGPVEEEKEFQDDALDSEIDNEFLEWLCMQNEIEAPGLKNGVIK